MRQGQRPSSTAARFRIDSGSRTPDGADMRGLMSRTEAFTGGSASLSALIAPGQANPAAPHDALSPPTRPPASTLPAEEHG